MQPPLQNNNNILRWGSLVLLVVQNCSAVLLMRYVQSASSASSSGANTIKRDPFSIPVANLCVEVVKFLICAAVVVFSTSNSKEDNKTDPTKDREEKPDEEDQKKIFSPANGKDDRDHHHSVLSIIHEKINELKSIIFSRTALQMAIPATLFTIQNNLLFVALANLEATLFQVTYQLKLLCTAILMVTMLGKELTKIKWLALVLLFCGIVLTQLKKSPFASSSRDEETSPSLSPKTSKATALNDVGNEENFLLGMFAVVTCAFCSAFASVYFEKVLKTQSSSIFVRNVQLAVFSFGLNFLVWVFSRKSNNKNDSSPSSSDPFAGFDSLVWILVFVQAAGGLLVAVVIKYCDNILKTFATSAAIIVSGIFSYIWLGFEPTWMFLVGAAIVIASTTLYGLW